MSQSPLQKALKKLEKAKHYNCMLSDNDEVVYLSDAVDIIQKMELDYIKEAEERKTAQKHY